MFNKVELIGGAVSICLMFVALYMVQMRATMPNLSETQQSAQLAGASGIVMVTDDDERAGFGGSVANNNIKDMVVDDVKIGTGEEVKKGDIVAVHYVGTLQNGEEFDSSRKRGETFEFEVGGQQVIAGWDEGVLGMQVGGERTLVIPPEKAYGDRGIGPIPGGATLLFTIELIEIK